MKKQPQEGRGLTRLRRREREPASKEKSTKAGRLKLRVLIARAAVVAGSFVLLYAMLAASLTPHQYDLKVGKPSPATILATRDIEDTVTTEALRQAARDEVDEKYKQDNTVTEAVKAALGDLFVSIADVRKDAADFLAAQTPQPAEGGEGGEPTPTQAPATPTYTEAFLQQCRDKLQPISSLKDTELLYLMSMPQKDLDTLQELVENLVSNAMDNGIKENLLSEQITRINREIINATTSLDSDAQQLGMTIVSGVVKANLLYDGAATEEARALAAAEVEPVRYQDKQTIVSQGEIVTQAQLEVIRSLGLLQDNTFHLGPYAGLFAVLALTYVAIITYVYHFEKELGFSQPRLILLSCIIVLAAALCWLGKNFSPLLLPIPLAAMLLSQLINRRIALVGSVMLSILSMVMLLGTQGLQTVTAISTTVAALLGSIIAINMLNRSSQRTAAITTGLVVGLAQAAIFITFDLLGGVDITLATLKDTVFTPLLIGLANGLVSAIVCLGTLPIWENIFDLTTPMKLMELSNPNQPLLKRLLLEAPGTYHHSVVVGNLAESAAEAVGAGAMLARTAAYYHDIGKLSRPFFFAENQTGGENPHDSLTPELSKRILQAHVTDGIELAKKYRLPKPIIDVIAQHHGTTTAAFFLYKARQQAENPDDIPEEEYRYPGPRPRSKVAAIMMLADATEAAVRTMPTHDREAVEAKVRQIVKGRLGDGQLDESDLTLRDIEKVVEVFVNVFQGIYHERVVYPPMMAAGTSTPALDK